MEGISCNFGDEPDLINNWLNEGFISVAWAIGDLIEFPTIELIRHELENNDDNNVHSAHQPRTFRDLPIGTRLYTSVSG